MTCIYEALAGCFQEVKGAECHYFIGRDFPAFEGHFPGRPILPAVVQIQFVLDALNRIRGGKYRLKKVSKAKFTLPVEPESRLQIEVTEKESGHFSARLGLENGKTCGQISFEAEAEI